jgi:hypothetical protein
MQMPRVRFTVRSMMVVVAIVAVAIWTPMWAKSQLDARRTYFVELARQYYDKRMIACSFAYSGPGGAIMEERIKADKVRRDRASVYYSDLIQKYLRAARYPWLPVGPDPPEPPGINDNQIVIK